jgi:hypothetical protein
MLQSRGESVSNAGEGVVIAEQSLKTRRKGVWEDGEVVARAVQFGDC